MYFRVSIASRSEVVRICVLLQSAIVLVTRTRCTRCGFSHLGDFSPSQRLNYQPCLMPYRDVGAANQSMDSHQPNVSREFVRIHNFYLSSPRRRENTVSQSAAASRTMTTTTTTRVTSPLVEGEPRRDSFYLLALDESRPQSESREKTIATGSG